MKDSKLKEENNTIDFFTIKLSLLLPCGRPKCKIEGCNNPGQHTGKRRKSDGCVIYRKTCENHHALEINSKNAYKANRKNTCDNTDGRLGFKCNNTFVDLCMLSVDHIDENHDNPDITNQHTLCNCCHGFKTKYFRPYRDYSGIISNCFTENIRFFMLNPSSTLSPNYYKVVTRDLDVGPFEDINTKKKVKKSKKLDDKLFEQSNTAIQ